MASNTIRAEGARLGEGVRAALARRVAELALREPYRVEQAVFVEHVLARVMADHDSGITDAEGLLAGVHLPELLLTYACSTGEPRALAAFEQRYVQVLLTERIGRVRLAAHEVEEVRQKLREDLLIDRGQGCRIAQYSGRGDLAGFVRVSALRIALKLVQKRDPAQADDDAMDRISLERDPELAFVKETYRPAFSQAFREGIAALEGRERLLLRQQVVDGLSIDALGTLYGVHRSTVARWLVTARESLLAKTRAAFASKLALKPQELDSLLELLHSRLDLSLRNVL